MMDIKVYSLVVPGLAVFSNSSLINMYSFGKMEQYMNSSMKRSASGLMMFLLLRGTTSI